jgi:DNA-binding NarL/FixJ family response regulator
MTPIRILLAEDHALVRAGFRSLLHSFSGVEVVGEANDGREALRLIEVLRPNIVLMDIMMPGLNGLEATARVSKEFPTVRVIILSMNAAEEYVLQAMRAGASGYLLKDGSITELEQAIRAVARGEKFLSSAVSKYVIAGYVQRSLGGSPGAHASGSDIGADAGGPAHSGSPPGSEKLTPRQREILQLIAEGNTTKEIAKKLEISVKTVETHRTQLMERLDIHDIAGLVRYSIRVGLVEVGK